MACTYDITTDRGKVRLIINDTALVGCIFSDLEIDTFLSMNSGDVNLAAADSLEAWMSKYATSPDSERIGDYAYTQKIIANMNKLRNELRDKADVTPIFEISEMDFTGIEDTSIEDE